MQNSKVLLLFNTYITDLDYSLRRFSSDTRSEGVIDKPGGYAAIQRNLNKLDKWADRDLMKFCVWKQKVLYLARNNPMHQDMLGANYLENSFAE